MGIIAPNVIQGGGMDTPWGNLQDIEKADKNLHLEILSTDKDALIEGLVVENTFDQILDSIRAAPDVGERPQQDGAEPDFSILDVETIIAAVGASRYVFVWARSMSVGLRRYLMALERVMQVYLVRFSNGEFVATEIVAGTQGKRSGPIQVIARELSGSEGKVVEVSRIVRDQNRIHGAYWGFLENVYRDGLWDKVVLGRLLINHGISPYFRKVWNIDRVCLYGGTLWTLEVKHKYPFGDTNLRFGINLGELENIDIMRRAGIGCLHVLLVKPRWVKDEGSLYLFNDRKLAKRVAVVSMNISEQSERLLADGRRKVSGKHTSITGKSTMSTVMFPCNDMKFAGTLSDDDLRLARSLLGVMDGTHAPTPTSSLLQGLCVYREPFQRLGRLPGGH